MSAIPPKRGLSASGLHSRPSNHSRTSTATLGATDGAIGEEAAELLEEFAGTHRHHHDSEDLRTHDESESSKIEGWKKLPWWKRPSPWWLIAAVPFSAIAKTAALAPQVELFIQLACRVHKPDIFNSGHGLNDTSPVLEMALPPAAVVHTPVPVSAIGDIPSQHDKRAAAVLRKPASPCAADPTVQAAVARLSAVTSTTMGVLSLLTTGWWGAFSDRHGRTTILGISLFGLLITDFTIILVYYFSESLPGNYWFLMIGVVLEGLFGGFSTAVAANHAYIAETTTEATRARYLSTSLGLMFTGMAFGPTIGSLLIRATETVISVFYLTTTVHLLYAVLIFLILPEPLSKQRMKESQRRYTEELRENAEEAREGAAAWKLKAKRLFRFLSPLSIFMPSFVDNGRNPLKRKERDWTLALIAVAYGFTISIISSTSFVFQYATATFGWSSETLGYWLSLVGAGRAVMLAIVLPIIYKFFKPPPMIIEIPPSSTQTAHSAEEEPLLSADANEEANNSEESVKPIKKELHSPRFELNVARFSLIVDIAAYGSMVALASQTTFVAFGLFGALGIGFSPAMQTLALAMYARRGGTETGRLFGALSVVQALSGQILGPAVYGFVYIRTVVVFPRAIFLVGLVSVAVSFILMSFVRLPKDSELMKEITGAYHRGDLEEDGASEGEVQLDEAAVSEAGAGHDLSGRRS
ncbi:hypothetical protein NMY22_g4751 [Coprinellus aureogranulatus]|nr:hypothetical protein NMY22_g4751 [Coprinellus aureogranulatus]